MSTGYSVMRTFEIEYTGTTIVEADTEEMAKSAVQYDLQEMFGGDPETIVLEVIKKDV